MKYFIALLFVLIASVSYGQINLEHIYPPVNNPGNSIYDNVSLREVDSGVWKYIVYNGWDSLYLFNLDHSFDHWIIIKDSALTSHWDLQISYFSKKLFDLDDKYEYMIGSGSVIRVYKEDGTLIFGCEQCFPKDLVNTPEGVKMLIGYDYYGKTAVFSLPGRLPSGNAIRSGVNPSSIISTNSLPTSVYPNPSTGQVHIAYTLPEGVSSGEIIITDIKGVEIKRYKVRNFFSDILIQNSDLPSGSYFYKVVTEKGESEAKKIVIIK
jgi:hypothetical protein